jgi:hypothetical protein
MKRTLLHRIAEALRSIDHDSAPAEAEHAPAQPVEPEPEPLPPCQRRVKVSFDEVLAARGYSYPYVRRQIGPPSEAERARRAAEAAMGRAGQDALWPD